MRFLTTVLAAFVATGCLGREAAGDEPPPTSSETTADVYTDPAQHDIPWEDSGWSERQAAGHLMSRFTYGARPEDIDYALEMGLEAWLAEQLTGELDESEPMGIGDSLPAVGMTSREIGMTYVPAPQIVVMAAEAGLDEVSLAALELGPERRRERDGLLELIHSELGVLPINELYKQVLTQRAARAIVANNQVREVLADFWFNHFHVSATDPALAPYLLDYDLNAIREYALSDFETLLCAVATHPAMLVYLDNARSTFVPEGMDLGGFSSGLNENYARELLELHTLGVDGGYTEEDVREVARALTGWSVYPAQRDLENVRRDIDNSPISDIYGDFVFHFGLHDSEPKTILGQEFDGTGGLDEGFEVLGLLAHHESTAAFVSRKFVVRFAADEPPDELVDAVETAFLESGGETRAMVWALVEHPMFWTDEIRGAKLKTPFELLAGTVRLLNGQGHSIDGVFMALDRMGQVPFRYEPPTGFPDNAEQWTGTGALVTRMNFGLLVALGEFPGIAFDPELAATDEASVRAFVERTLPAHSDAERAALLERIAASQLAHPAPRARQEPHASMQARIDSLGAILASPEYQAR